jgi:hypothetical protein
MQILTCARHCERIALLGGEERVRVSAVRERRDPFARFFFIPGWKSLAFRLTLRHRRRSPGVDHDARRSYDRIWRSHRNPVVRLGGHDLTASCRKPK